jgi:hypothetical protein
VSARGRGGSAREGGAATRSRPAPRARRSAKEPVARVTVAANSRAERAALVIGIALGLLTLARGVLAFVPTMWFWGLNALRFVPPVFAVALWSVAALAMAPALARRLEPSFAAAGNAIARRRWTATLGWIVGTMLVVVLVPDRIWYVGDFVLRQAMVVANQLSDPLLQQAAPLERLLHNILPRDLIGLGLGFDANGVARLMGALEAGALAWLAVRFARVLDLRGTAAVATTAIVLAGGYLSMYTGYAKAASEMVLLTAAVGVFGVQVLRGGRGLLPLNLAVALGIAVHRSALAFLPALALAWIAWVVAARRSGRLAPALRSPRVIVSAALPLGVLAWMGPQLVRTLTGYDAAVHYASPEIRAAGGMVQAALSGLRPLDLMNLLLILVPALPLGVCAAVVLGRPRWREGGLPLLLALTLPLGLGIPLLVHTGQGTFRDWDVFSASGMSLSLTSAWFVAKALGAAPSRSWVAIPVAIGVASASVSWLAAQADTTYGLARVHAYLTEAPLRTGLEAGQSWEYLGMFESRLGRREEAAASLARAAAITPSPTVLRYWAILEAQLGRRGRAQDIVHLLLARDPRNLEGWTMLLQLSFQTGDSTAARAALAQLVRLDSDGADLSSRLGRIGISGAEAARLSSGADTRGGAR